MSEGHGAIRQPFAERSSEVDRGTIQSEIVWVEAGISSALVQTLPEYEKISTAKRTVDLRALDPSDLAARRADHLIGYRAAARLIA